MNIEQAKSQFPNRYTMEHVPQWAKAPSPNGKFHAPQYTSDLEWYNNTRFPETKREKYCESTGQTWPLGQWLDSPYIIESRQ